MRRFYLDHNATSRLGPEVRETMRRLLGDEVGNPSSAHAEGRRARAEIDLARDAAAAWLRAKSSEIIFTGGGTESCNLAIQGLSRAHAARGRHLITVKTEHHAVLHAFQALERRDGFAVTYLDVDSGGLVDPRVLLAAIRPDTILVSVMSANNETGVRQPLEAIGEICARHKILFHTDAVQSAGKEPIELGSWQVSAVSVTAHKFHGPSGAGLLWLKAGIPLARLMEGGTHENERRPGTENVVAIAGLAAAIQAYGTWDAIENERQHRWTERLWQKLSSLGDIRRNGNPGRRLANTLNVSVGGLDGQDFLMALDLAGLSVSNGSACMVGASRPSHVLAAMGVPDDLASATVRFSIDNQTADDDLEEIFSRIARIVTFQRSLSRPAAERAGRREVLA